MSHSFFTPPSSPARLLLPLSSHAILRVFRVLYDSRRYCRRSLSLDPRLKPSKEPISTCLDYRKPWRSKSWSSFLLHMDGSSLRASYAITLQVSQNVLFKIDLDWVRGRRESLLWLHDQKLPSLSGREEETSHCSVSAGTDWSRHLRLVSYSSFSFGSLVNRSIVCPDEGVLQSINQSSSEWLDSLALALTGYGYELSFLQDFLRRRRSSTNDHIGLYQFIRSYHLCIN